MTSDTFRIAFEEAVVGLALTSAEGRYAYVNRALCEMLGYAREELIGMRVSDVTHPEDFPKDGQAMRDLLDGKVRIYRREKRYFHKSGAVVWGRLSTTIVRDSSGNVLFNSTIVDITEQKRAERALEEHRAMAMAVSKMSALGEMAGGIAHEINNPLTLIHGAALGLARLAKLETVPGKDVLRHASGIESTVMRISRIVSALHAFSRDSRQDPFEIVTARSIVDDTFAFCQARFRKSKVELRVEGNAGVELECRPVQISQVLLNLLNNAHDAVQGAADKWVRVVIEDSGAQITLRVSDSGAGISETVAQRLFQPFFTTKPPGSGTGLGLSVSRGIVESHRGALSLERGEPTTFVVTLPKWQSGETAEAA